MSVAVPTRVPAVSVLARGLRRARPASLPRTARMWYNYGSNARQGARRSR